MKSWIKRYAIGCLVVLFALSANDGYRRPHDIRFGTNLIIAAAWPVSLAIVAGAVFGDAFREQS
jgi:hypothetical protein